MSAHPYRALAALLALVLGPAQATTLQQCRALQDDRARLACYDAIEVGSVRGDARPSVPPATAGAEPSPGAAAAAATAADRFGLPAPAPAVTEVRSQILGRFEGWQRDTVLTLKNGQAWRVVDGSRAVYDLDSPGVRIVPGVLGSFMLEVEGVAQRARVKRVK